MFQKIVDLIRRPKPSAAELQAALSEIDPKAAEALVDQLEADRQKLLLRPDTDVELEAIEVKIRTGNRNVERQYVARRELERLLAEAQEREAREAIERVADGARSARTQLLHLYSRADELAGELAAVLEEISQARNTLKHAATITTEARRPDLRVHDPIGALAQHLGHASSDALVDPLTWHLRYYWPLRDGNGFPLKVDRSLGRARELLDNVPAKKAA